ARASGVAVARSAIPSATLAYCSARRLDTEMVLATLPKPLPSSSGGSRLAGCVVSPKRSRTVLLYSKRVRRRIGERPPDIVFGSHEVAARAPPSLAGTPAISAPSAMGSAGL